MTFYNYCLRRYKGTYTPGADILRDMQLDPGFPRKASTRRTIMDYIISKGACSNCEAAFSDALTEYEIIRPPARKVKEYAMSFYDFIVWFSGGDEFPAGHVFHDIINDHDFPRLTTSRKDILAYVDSKACNPDWRSWIVSHLLTYDEEMACMAKAKSYRRDALRRLQDAKAKLLMTGK